MPTMHAYSHPAKVAAAIASPAAAAIAALLLLAGCTPSTPETPEQTRYLDEVYDAAEHNGLTWEDSTHAAVLATGTQTCGALERGDTLARIYAAARSEDEKLDAVIRLAVTYAPIYLCPEVGQ